MKEIEWIEEEINNIPSSKPSTPTQQKTNVESTDVGGETYPTESTSTVQLNDPNDANPKGRPAIVGRQRTLMEQINSMERITCSGCGSHDHNI